MRILLAGLVATALSLGPMGAAPAQAGEKDLAKFLAGAVTLGIIGAAIHDRRNSHSKPATQYQHRPQHRDQKYHHPNRGNPKGYGKSRHAKTVPAQCLRAAQTRKGQQRFFDRNCLQRTMRNVERLPNACAIRINNRAHGRIGYEPNCLRRHGWSRS